MSLPTISRKARFWPALPHKTITMPSPPAAPKPPNASTLIPLGFSFAGIAFSIWLFSQFNASISGGYYVGFIALTAFASLGSFIAFFIQRATISREIQLLQRQYSHRLREIEQDLKKLQHQERQARLDADPPFRVRENAAKLYEKLDLIPLSQRVIGEMDLQLWSRQAGDPDFLAPRIGMGLVQASFAIQSPPEEMIVLPGPFDRLNDTARTLAGFYATLPAPVTVALQDHPVVGILAGNHDLGQSRGVARMIVAQLAYHHSPEDLRIIVLAPQSQESSWLWARELPHTRLEDMTASSNGERVLAPNAVAIGKDAVGERLTWISRELNRRELSIGGDTRSGQSPAKDNRILPRLVIVVDHFDPELDLDSIPIPTASQTTTSARSRLPVPPIKRPEMTLALSRGTDLGVAVIAICPTKIQLPSTTDVVVELAPQPAQEAAQIRWLRDDPPPPITCDVIDDGQPQELFHFATQMRGLRPATSKRLQLRTQIDIRSLFDTQLDINHPESFWGDPALRLSPEQLRGKTPIPRMRAPIGYKIGDEIQFLDLVRDGPHGLLIGQTGSGKSELLQTIITSFALCYKPTELNFLLIDYKAGLALAPYHRLSHTIGFLSNVSSPAQIQRFITMLSAEAVRREVLLREGKELPRLLIIIDEFAEMVNRVPAVLDELFTIMRVGREIGIFLMFSSQRPEGVIGRVRDYVQYRFCLRVPSNDDSREVLGRTDAAELPVSAPGRGYLLHGDNQLDLFQAARVTLPVASHLSGTTYSRSAR